jgi:excisionase family DNA binding protein
MSKRRATVSIGQACELCGVSRRTIYNWLGANKVEYVRTAGGCVRIFEDALFTAPGAPRPVAPAVPVAPAPVEPPRPTLEDEIARRVRRAAPIVVPDPAPAPSTPVPPLRAKHIAGYVPPKGSIAMQFVGQVHR